jgi:hypothetical protein
MKRKTAVPCPELTLPASERRKRAKRMAAITTGCNDLTKRQIRRLPSRAVHSKHSARKEKRQMRRYMRKNGLTRRDFA